MKLKLGLESTTTNCDIKLFPFTCLIYLLLEDFNEELILLQVFSRMKTRFTTIDIKAVVFELKERLIIVLEFLVQARSLTLF